MIERTKRGLLIIVTVLIALAMSVSGCKREQFSKPEIEDQILKNLDEYLSAATELNRFSGSVLIARKDDVIFNRGYGMADREHHVPNTPKIKYRLGSVTKQFTAMAVLQLYEEGKLRLKDPITRFMPQYDDNRGITVFHLLTHSSGLPDYTAFEGVQTRAKVPITKKEIIKSLWGKPLRFSPGEKFNYCNSNYVVLGQIIEQISGKSYEAYVDDNIFSPLDMENSGYDHPEVVLENRAEGYVNMGGKILNAGFIDTSFPNAAGALYSTVGDLHKWCLALTSAELVSRELMEEAMTAQVGDYGYGFMEGTLWGSRRVYHGGTVNGFKTMINIFPELKLSIIVLANLETAQIEQISRDLSAIVFGEDYEIPQQVSFVKLKEEILETYSGKYEAGNGYTVEILKNKDHLTVILPGQPELAVFPRSEKQFSPKGAGLVVEFEVDADGRVAGLTITQERRSLEAEKVN